MSGASSDPRSTRIGCIALFVLTAAQCVNHSRLAWWPGFSQDDFCWLEDARRSLSDPRHLGTLHISGFFRPLVHATFAANYAASGMSPGSYYAVNIALEAACILLVGLLARRLGLGPWGMLAAAAAFATHGSHDEILGWISGRTTSLWTLMGLSALLCWSKWRGGGGRHWYVAAVAGCAAALLCKEEAAALPLVLAAMDWIMFPRESATWRRRFTAWLPLVLLTAAYLLMQWSFQSRNLLVHQGQYQFSAAMLGSVLQRMPSLFLTQRIIPLPQALLYIAAGLAIGWIVFRDAQRSTARVALFGIALATCAFLPTTPFLYPHNTAGRYSYFATIGTALVCGAMLKAVIEMPRPRALSAFVFILLGAGLITQNHHQRSGLRYWKRESQLGAAVLEGVRRSPVLDEVARSTSGMIHVANPPIGIAHFQSAAWLVWGVEPSRVSADANPPSPPVVQLRWNEQTMRLESDYRP